MIAPDKLRVLLLAESCNPEWTSVPLLGWLHVSALSKICDVHLVTQVRNRDAVARQGWKEGEDFTAIDTEAVTRKTYKLANKIRGGKELGWTITTAFQSLSYPYFEYKVWKRFSKALKAGQFDLVHRVTPVSPTSPSMISSKLKKISVPFIVGPLNGGVEWPKEFKNIERKEKEWLNKVRGLYKFLPGYRSTRVHSAAMLAGSMATKTQLPQFTLNKQFYIPENAVDTSRFYRTAELCVSKPVKGVFVGRIVPYKGLDMAILAILDLVKENQMEFDIYGHGPAETECKEVVAAHGLQRSIRFHGFVPNTELCDKLVQADVLVFPSIREFGGGVVLETMALGIVPVIVDYAGPSELVTSKSGYKVPMGTRAEIIAGLRSTLRQICDDPSSLLQKKKECMDRVEKYYTWDKKASQVCEIYDWCLGRSEKPVYDQPFE